MDYTKYQDKTIRKIAGSHKSWYKSRGGVWGERYMKEKEGVLTKDRTKKETRIILIVIPWMYFPK